MVNNRFRGYFRHAVDDKGRVAIPASFRANLSKGARNHLVLNKGRDNTIEVHPLVEWEKFEDSIALKLSRFHSEPLRIRRLLEQNVVTVKIDSQGRILIPQHFKEYAQIKNEAIIAGVGNYFEIWNPENFENYVRDAQVHFYSDLENIEKYLELSKKLKINENE
ncbi:MAG: division/cell wall cluster transcriptional repressor MraZ [candidate division WOR-3 bacterium]|nr:division/cell wall cluster transcriptional repressor MraZ [candidate division WOR-3 bacterium]MCX7757340.1 division/cell wall cluster transcriptional repressor MraZ [candidate division WOR-3 bacterium]MDW7988262.1 division/cell wall cluster transcriptional repressor MraZ [candidate division WOR-3 bacterium]